MPLASLHEQLTAVSMYYDTGCVEKYLHAGVNTSVCMVGHTAGAFNNHFAKLSLRNNKLKIVLVSSL